jgi:photosystem II stability/assembly factor-like uncharacterized protein
MPSGPQAHAGAARGRSNAAGLADGATRTKDPWRPSPAGSKLGGVPEQLLIVTGDDVVRLTLAGKVISDAEVVLDSAGAQCVAIDPHDPDRAYVGTFDRGLFATDDGGRSWRSAESRLHDQRVLSVSVSPSDRDGGPSAVYAGTEPSNLYRSDDGGRSWRVLPALRTLPSEPNWSFPPRPWTHHVSTIALHPTDPDRLIVGIELGGVMRSHDRGESWLDHNPRAHSDAHQLLIDPVAPERVYEAAGQGIARSDDLGETWRRYEGGLDRHYAWAVAVDPVDPDRWYVSVSRGPFAAHGGGDGQSVLLRASCERNGGRENGGDGSTFTRIDAWGGEPELRRMPYALATVPGRADWLLAGLRGGTLLVSDDAGESWTRLGADVPDIVDLALAPR